MTKKNNPQDEQIEEMLHRVLGRYHEILFKAANSKKDEDIYGYQQRFIKAMETGSIALKTAAKSVVDKYIPNVDSPVSNLLQSYGARYGGEEIKLTTYVRMVSSITNSIGEYRQRIDEQIRERERQGKITTVGDLQGIIIDDLNNDRITVVKYANGKEVPVDKYAAMLARSTRAETENLAMIQQALREGLDLVECDIVSPTCDSCAVLQGRIYSISGKDSRYPALYKTAFKSGYSIIHPNCRHSWSVYHKELYSEEEQRQALERSNRSWNPDGDGKAFQQTERAREQYAAGQQKMRQWNSEIVEYERMRAHYERIGQEPPYKTLGAFRREVRKSVKQQSPIMRQWKNREGDAKEYETIQQLLGENAPETFDKFKEMKYNDIEQYRLIRREVRMIRESVGQPKLPNAGQANMPKEKTYGYVLNPEHETGQHKARVIQSALGFNQEDYREFANQVIKNLAYYKAVEKNPTEYGRKFSVRMILVGKNGKRLLVETVWQIDKASKTPRFITITFPKK